MSFLQKAIAEGATRITVVTLSTSVRPIV